MTTVILTLIGILLAGASVLFVIFYGGDAFYAGEIRSEASRLTVEGNQVENSVRSYTIREGKIPGNGVDPETSMQDVLEEKFLETVPLGAETPWIIDYPNEIIRTDIGALDDERALSICREARARQSLPEPETVYQCDGSDHPNNNGRLPANEPCCVF